MSKIIQLRSILVTLVIFLLLSKFSPAYSTFTFSDSFLEGYSNSWQINPNSLSPISSLHGIGAADNSQWSDILLPISENATYHITFDLWINSDVASNVWRLYIINSTFNNYKIINNWGSSNLLQISEPNGLDILKSWTHGVGPHHFEITLSPLSNTTIKIIEDGNEIFNSLSLAGFDVAYLNLGLLGQNGYELSNFYMSTNIPEPSPSPTLIPTYTPTPLLTPTPISTNTPTPTLIPTHTPTPTPTPPHSTKVIVIPGFGASWNAEALFNCRADGYQGAWVLHPLEKSIYPSLYNALTNAGYTPIPFYYDWRKQLGSHNEILSTFISSNTNTNEHVDLVGHSFGGLVGRAYISNTQANSKIDKYLSAGSPHQGAPFAYPAWAGGELWKTDFNYWIYMTTIMKLCQIRYRIDAQEAIQRFVPSTQDVLPLFPYLRDIRSNQLKTLSSMRLTNIWLPSHPLLTTWGTVIGTLSGYGQETLSSIVVKEPSRNETRDGEWLDGKPIKKEYSNEGDGTILLQSSQILNADNRIIQGDHASIVGSTTGQQEIISFLNGTQNFQALRFRNIQIPVSKKTSALLVLSYPAHATLTDPDGNTTTDTDGLIAIEEPKKGRYSISVSPSRLGHTKIIVAQFYDNGKYFWKEYSHWLPYKKQMKIYINPKNPSDDIDHDRH